VEVRGFFVSLVNVFVVLFLLLSLVIALIVVAALLAHEKGKAKQASPGVIKDEGKGFESSLRPMSCDVVVVGGGISGMYMAETLMRMKKEDTVCLFERDSRLGGRIYDYRFSQAPNISISLGAWRVDREHKRVMALTKRLNIPMLKMDIKIAHWETRGVFVSSTQALKEQAFPTLLSGPFANMTSSEMMKYAWMNITREKTLEFPSYRDFVCHQLGSEGCEFVMAMYALKRIYGEESTLSRYERNEAYSNHSYDYYRPPGGLSDIISALERSAKRLGVKMYVKEKVKAIHRKGNIFTVDTDSFTVSARKLIIAVPRTPFEEISGDVAADIKRNVFFEAILPLPVFKAVALYAYPWWENITSLHNLTLKPLERFFSGASCLVGIMPYSDRGPHGEAVLQLSYAWRACAVKWGELSKLPKAVLQSELKKAIQEVFPGAILPEPLDMVFKYWEKVAWHNTKAGSNVSRYDLMKWAKRPFPGEDVFIVGEAYSVFTEWNEGALQSAYNALKEGWEITQPEAY